MIIELAVFDLSCLVEGLGDTCIRALLHAANGARITVSEDDARSVLGLPVRRATAALVHTVRDLEAQVARSDAAYDLFVADLVDRFSRQHAVREVARTRDTLASFAVLGARVAITTNLPRVVAAPILASVDWHDLDLVDAIVTTDDVDDPRPRPGMLLEAMARTGCRSSRAVVAVGDTPAALVEGTLARCGLVIGALHGSHGRSELELRPHTHLVDRLIDVVELARNASGGEVRDNQTP